MADSEQTISKRLKEWKRNFYLPGKSWEDLESIIKDLEVYESRTGELANKVISALEARAEAMASKKG